MFDLVKSYGIIISCHEQWENTKNKSQDIDITSISLGNERIIKNHTINDLFEVPIRNRLVIVECKLPFVYNIVIDQLQQSRQDGDDRVGIL